MHIPFVQPRFSKVQLYVDCSAAYAVIVSKVTCQLSMIHLSQASCVFARSKHWLECFMTISTWPTFVAFIGAKRHVITWINVSPLSPFSLCLLSFRISMHIFFRLPCNYCCSPVCSERSSSACWGLVQEAKHASWKRFSSRPLPPTALRAQWSVPKSASGGFRPHLTPVRIHTWKIGMKIETQAN